MRRKYTRAVGMSADELVKLRQSVNMTQAEFAVLVGVRPEHVNRLERGVHGIGELRAAEIRRLVAAALQPQPTPATA